MRSEAHHAVDKPSGRTDAPTVVQPDVCASDVAFGDAGVNEGSAVPMLPPCRHIDLVLNDETSVGSVPAF